MGNLINIVAYGDKLILDNMAIGKSRGECRGCDHEKMGNLINEVIAEDSDLLI